ncbi:MAG: hypothetical protein AAFO87_01915 [Cyanobacteria bacterium J06607_6]
MIAGWVNSGESLGTGIQGLGWTDGEAQQWEAVRMGPDCRR